MTKRRILETILSGALWVPELTLNLGIQISQGGHSVKKRYEKPKLEIQRFTPEEEIAGGGLMLSGTSTFFDPSFPW